MIQEQKNIKNIWYQIPFLWLWIVLLLWSLTAGPDWFGQLHAKWREVKLYAFLPQSEQRNRIFGTEMALLSAEVATFSEISPDVPVLIPPQPWPYPIGNNPPLLRALTNGQRDFILWTEQDPAVGGILFWPDDGSAYLPPVTGLNPDLIDWRVLSTQRGRL